MPRRSSCSVGRRHFKKSALPIKSHIANEKPCWAKPNLAPPISENTWQAPESALVGVQYPCTPHWGPLRYQGQRGKQYAEFNAFVTDFFTHTATPLVLYLFGIHESVKLHLSHQLTSLLSTCTQTNIASNLIHTDSMYQNFPSHNISI